MTEKMVYNSLLTRIQDELSCDLVAIALVESAEKQYVLKWRYTMGQVNDRLKNIVLQTGKGIAGEVFKTGKPCLIKDVSTFARKNELFNYPILLLENLKSIGAIPLWEKDRVIGVLLAGYRTPHLMNEKNVSQMLKKVEEEAITLTE
ncbi:GAF domain-containing protein [Alkalicoccobacillus gibsonii]|uniref:GAF domain-containing protein n=1 Tax=Alkalicoccobacillus gibsonii TaxID=79881 RepID=UPI003517CFE6